MDQRDAVRRGANRSLVLGMGEVGQALFNVLQDAYPETTAGKDVTDGFRLGDGWSERLPFEIHVLHICIPYRERFMNDVREAQQRFEPIDTVIHSTVPIGTSRTLNAVHSPIVGRHPYLEESLRTFTKFLGGTRASAVADHFRQAGIHVYITPKPEATELLKLDSTTWFGLCIEKTKDTKALCDIHGVPFELFTVWTEAYNRGYRALGEPQYARPNLIPIQTRIGGHCIIPNATLLDTPFTQFLLERNATE